MNTTQTEIPKGFSEPLARGVEDGIEWFTCRAPVWDAVNGYARLPEGHPWRGLSLQMEDYDKGPAIHGGITYGPDSAGWIGFDTAHSGDVWPGIPQSLVGTGWDRHWNEDMVAEEARHLARQIAEAAA
jgi:hypothetical protein